MIKITKKTEKIPVYDIEVKDNHNFFANGLCVHNCEISVPSHSLDKYRGFEGEVGSCILSNMNLGHTKENEIPKVADFLVRFLDSMIDISEFVLPEIEYAATKRRTLGVGISNLFGYLAKSKQFYNTKEARENINDIMEVFYYNLMKTSIELAKEKGKCDLFNESYYSNNKFIFERYKESGFKPEFKPKLDWESLREDLSKYGMRHSSLSAIPPAGNCVSEFHTIETYEGNFNLKDICKRESIDYNDLKVGWYDLKKPLKVPTYDGDSVSKRFYFNGEVNIIEVETNEGTIEVTPTHELLIETKDDTMWVESALLSRGDKIKRKNNRDSLIVKNIKIGKKVKTWDLEVEKYHNYFLDGDIISHNSSKPSSATPGVEPPRELVTIKTEKSSTIKQLVPFYKTSKKYYTTAWSEDFNNIDYLKLVSVIQNYIDQSISSNLYYDVRNTNGKVNIEQILNEMIFAFNNNLKTWYYSTFRSNDEADGEAEKQEGCDSGGCSV